MALLCHFKTFAFRLVSSHWLAAFCLFFFFFRLQPKAFPFPQEWRRVVGQLSRRNGKPRWPRNLVIARQPLDLFFYDANETDPCHHHHHPSSSSPFQIGLSWQWRSSIMAWPPLVRGHSSTKVNPVGGTSRNGVYRGGGLFSNRYPALRAVFIMNGTCCV